MGCAEMPTTPDIFIIESLDFDDESEGRCEGQFLSHLLRVSGRNVRYFYIRTLKEFEALLSFKWVDGHVG
jgi:hypothetical protein